MTEVNTPVGRILWGHPMKSQPVKDDRTKALKMKQDGVTPRVQWNFGLAIPKDQCAPLFDAMKAAMAEEFPRGEPRDFAWKYRDGDTDRDANNNPLAGKEGYAGCYIFACSTEFQCPPNYAFDHGTGKWVDTTDIKRGDYAVVTLDVKAHAAVGNGKPGLYLNPKIVCLWQVGAEIKGGDIDPNSRFAAPPVQTPAAPPPAAPGAAPGQRPLQGGAPAPAAPSPPGGSAPGNAAPPRHDAFLQGPGAQQQPAAPGTPPGGRRQAIDDEIPF